jgi:hypothetical protein
MSMLSDFLKENGLKVEDLVARSSVIERTQIADRDLMTKRINARRQKKTYAELNIEKPKALGRGVSAAALGRALQGVPQPRIVRKKILRAVNSLLASKKSETTEWRKLFQDTPARHGEKKKK